MREIRYDESDGSNDENPMWKHLEENMRKLFPSDRDFEYFDFYFESMKGDKDNKYSYFNEKNRMLIQFF